MTTNKFVNINLFDNETSSEVINELKYLLTESLKVISAKELTH